MPKKKKQLGMGDYGASKEEQEAMRWCINNRVVKIAPKAAQRGPAPTSWYVDIWQNGKWVTSPQDYGPGEIWEVIYNYYVYYYEKYKNKI